MIDFSKSEKSFLRKVLSLSGKAINKHGMIQSNERILVAVSGGKDSLSLLDILAERRKYLPIDYDIHAIHIITEDVPYEIDKEFLGEFCSQLNVELHYLKTYAGISEKPHKKPCFTCSWNRRKELFEFARKNSFKKIAFGHHLDDAVETLLMNMTTHANISSIPAKISMFNDGIEVIRPLIYATNAEMVRYAKIKKFVSLKKECPYEDHTLRQKSRLIIDQLTDMNPQARINLFNSMSNIDADYLPH